MLLSVVAQTRGGSSAAEVEGAESGATAVHVSHKHDVVTPQLGRMKPLLMLFLCQGRWHQARAAAAELAAETLGVLLSSSVMQIEKDFRKRRYSARMPCIHSSASFVASVNACPVFHHQPPNHQASSIRLVEKHVLVYAGASCRYSSPSYCFVPSANFTFAKAASDIAIVKRVRKEHCFIISRSSQQRKSPSAPGRQTLTV
jgi:hypothetical protein